MRGRIQALTRLALDLQRRAAIDALLQTVVESTVDLLRADHGSVRLLNPARSRLVAVCRTGEPLHLEPVEFRNGEGLLGWITEHAKPIRLDEPHADTRFVPKPGVATLGPFLGVPLQANQTCFGVISVIRSEQGFDEDDERLLTLVAAISTPYLEIARLSRLSRVDPLTGALNRRGFDEAFSSKPPAGGVNLDPETPVSVIMIDIDHFKAINDTHGHAVGDEVLRHVARLLSAGLRAGDAIVRWGGEEFVLVLPNVSTRAAARIAERARATVEGSPTRVAKGIGVTVSAGVASRKSEESLDELIGRADASLYRAKQSGRNRVESD